MSPNLIFNLNMIVFIDESGDPGFKFTQGSSNNFVISLVIFDDEIDAEETALKKTQEITK